MSIFQNPCEGLSVGVQYMRDGLPRQIISMISESTYKPWKPTISSVKYGRKTQNIP